VSDAYATDGQQRVVQLRDELVPAGHFDAVLDEPEMLRERLDRTSLIPQLVIERPLMIA
jgi:hypothetical protein